MRHSVLPLTPVALLLSLSAPCLLGGCRGGSGGGGSDETSGGADGSDTGGEDGTGGGSMSCDEDCVPKSLVVAFDGARSDALRFAETPHVDSLIAGTWAEGYQGAYTPFAETVRDGDSYSAPNHVSMMTGVGVASHGVTDNSDASMQGGNYAAHPHYLSLLERADASLDTAYLFTWLSDSYILNEADYVSWGVEPKTTAEVVAMLGRTFENAQGMDGTAWSRDQDPDAIFLFYDFTDAAGHAHQFTPESAEYVTTLEEADAYLGQVLDAIKARPTFEAENWQIILTTDHGGYRNGHGGRTAPMENLGFLVASRDVVQGVVPPGAGNFDVVPTVLPHFGLMPSADMVGREQGKDAVASPEVELGRDVVAYLRFEGDLSDASTRGNDGIEGPASAVAPRVETSGGSNRGKLSLIDLAGSERANKTGVVAKGKVESKRLKFATCEI